MANTPPTSMSNRATSGAEWASIYAELRALAKRVLSSQRAHHTLQATALVHEIFLRSQRDSRTAPAECGEILTHAARAMRDVLVEHARRKGAHKRGGEAVREPLDDALAIYQERTTDLIALHQALESLQRLDPPLAQLVELRFFGGLTEAEAARALGISPRTVRRSWRTARLWLWRQLEGDSP